MTILLFQELLSYYLKRRFSERVMRGGKKVVKTLYVSEINTCTIILTLFYTKKTRF